MTDEKIIEELENKYSFDQSDLDLLKEALQKQREEIVEKIVGCMIIDKISNELGEMLIKSLKEGKS